MTTQLTESLLKFANQYHGNEKLVSQNAGWDCIIALHASDTEETLTLQIENGKMTQTGLAVEEVDLLVTSDQAVLLDVLELRRDANEPYLFGELTVQGPEAHFMRLDYITTMMSPL